MRIAITHAYSWPEVRRGAERIIYELSRALATHGHDVTVLTAGASASNTEADGVRTVRIRRRFDDNARHEAHFGLAAVPRLFTGRYDAVHSFGPEDARAAIRTKRFTGHRTVYTNLGLPVRRFWDHHPAAKAHAHVVRAIDVYGCMSQYALDEFRTEYGGEGTLTAGGVNLEEFRPAAERESSPTVLFSAALSEPRKGGAVLVKALDEVVDTEPDLKLWLSGPGDPASILSEASVRARKHIEVLPLGEANAQAERYGRAWVTALPSKSDSFGLVVIESLACGTPVVASNHSALPELITEGITGALCDPDDASTVASALRTAIRLARTNGTSEACRASVARFDWRTGIAPEFLKIYGG